MQTRHRNDLEDSEAGGLTYMPARMKDWEDQEGFDMDAYGFICRLHPHRYDCRLDF